MNRRYAPYVVAAGALALGALVGWTGVTGAGAFAAIILVALSFIFPRQTLPLLVAGAVLQYLPTRALNILPQPAVLLDDVMMLGIAFRLLADLALSRVRIPWWLLLPTGGFIAIGIFSAVVNMIDPGLATNALRALVLPMLLMPATAAYFGDVKSRGRLIYLVVLLTLANAFMSLAQWLSNPSRIDIASGFLGPGGANGSGFLSLIGLILVLTSSWPQWNRVFAALLASAGLLVSSARAAIVAAPAALLIAGWRTAGQSRGRRIASITLVLVLTLGMGYYYQIAGRDVSAEITPTVLLKGQSVAGHGGRLLYLYAVPAVWRTGGLSWIWGVGPGGYTSFVGMNSLAPAFVSQGRIREDSLTGFAYPDMQWTALLGEYGMLGTVLAVMAVILPVIRLRMNFGRSMNAIDSMAVTATPALMVVWITGMSAVNLMEYAPVAVPLWVVLGVACAATLDEVPSEL